MTDATIVGDLDETAPPSLETLDVARPLKLPRLGEVMAPLIQRFSAQGALGAAVVDASALARIEEKSGAEAYANALGNLAALVRGIADDLLDGEEVVAVGDPGRHEVLILLFRSRRDGSLYRTELPHLCQGLERALAQAALRVVYPYERRAPLLPVGYSAAQRDPFIGADSQLFAVLEDARDDARLAAAIVRRRRRRAFVGLVMGGDVTSVYEPIVDVATKTVFGYEALARGPADGDFHSPLVLFQTAIEEGLVFELDCLCRQAGLDGAVGLPEGTRLFLNVRPTTIHDPHFKPDALIRTLERSKLRPSDVVFEISEQESIESFDLFREIRDEYRQLGFQFALDDTGAGYASLQAVLELEPEFIKIDRALVAGLDQDRSRQTLVRALESVAADIGAKIIAEGLDTLEELEILGELGIAFGQGWLFGKPTPLRAGS